jgi:hypothetical protein
MALDFGMLQPVNISGQLMAGQQQAQQNQLAQQQLKQSGMQMEQTQLQVDQLKRDRDALAKLQEQFVANGKSPDLEENFGAMIQSGIPHFVDIGTQGLQKIQQQKQFASIMGGGAAAPAAPAASVNALAPAAAAPATSVNALASGSDVSGLRQKRDALLAMGTQQSIAAAKALDADIALAAREPVYHNVPGVGLVDPRTKQVIMSSVESTQPEIKQYEYARAQGYKGSLFDFKREMAQAGRAPAAPRPESAPVAVVDPVTGKQVLVSREEALRGRMTPAAAMEGLAPKDIRTREAKYPQAKQATTTVSATMNEIDATIQRLLDNEKGLNGITGLVYGNTMALTDAARKAQADLKQLKNLAFVQGLTELRNASSTGAGVGNVSNKEGDRFENLKSSLEQSQSTQDLRDSLIRLKSQANATNETVKQAFEDTYSYRNNVAAPAAATEPALNVVVTPDGQSHTFPTPAAAAQFKKAVGIK